MVIWYRVTAALVVLMVLLDGFKMLKLGLFSRLNSMAARVLHVFVRHVSLLRNLGEGGKLRLAADMAQVRTGGSLRGWNV